MRMKLLFSAAALLVVSIGATATPDDTYACSTLSGRAKQSGWGRSKFDAAAPSGATPLTKQDLARAHEPSQRRCRGPTSRRVTTF
jgi:hypothetical protein